MKCPSCGLVHSPADQVCRRCEIDLVSGEPRSRAGTGPAPRPAAVAAAIPVKAKTGAGQDREPAKDYAPPARTEKVRPETRRKPDLEVVVLRSGQEEESPEEPEALASPGKPRRVLGRALDFLGLTGLKSIRCVQCNGSMTIERERPYSRSGPISLLVLGGALAVVALFYHYLFITAALSIMAGVIYLRMGQSSWKCLSCGMLVPRS